MTRLLLILPLLLLPACNHLDAFGISYSDKEGRTLSINAVPRHHSGKEPVKVDPGK